MLLESTKRSVSNNPLKAIGFGFVLGLLLRRIL